jgi:hypothetical protein
MPYQLAQNNIMPINYVTGDATAPLGPGPKVVIHVVNNAGGWGKGFVLALSRRWSTPEHAYRRWAAGPRTAFVMGMIQPVPVTHDITVLNLLAQDGFPSPTNPVPLDYDALRVWLEVELVQKGVPVTIYDLPTPSRK